jgi:hypothetical protein
VIQIHRGSMREDELYSDMNKMDGSDQFCYFLI